MAPHDPASNQGYGDRETAEGRRRRGVLVGLAVAALAAVPAAGCAILAIVSFTGCLIECGDPAPGRGATWSAVTAVLLALPFVAGAAAARVPLRRVVPWLLGLFGATTLVLLLAHRVM